MQACIYCGPSDLTKPDQPICGDHAVIKRFEWVCTRPPGHEGDHVACGAFHATQQWINWNSVTASEPR